MDQFRQVLELGKNKKISEAAEQLRISAGRESMNRIRELAGEMRREEQRLLPQERTIAADRSQSLAAAVTTSGAWLVVILASHLDRATAPLGESTRRGRGQIARRQSQSGIDRDRAHRRSARGQ
ncbi:MAG: CHASE3 domain-containing protein [Rhodopseudomonas palustris]|nr:CHASE3 domain-containing protein [Rhodopseudomonas palustris]